MKPAADMPTTKMTTGSSANSGYAAGWSVNTSRNWWHGGSLPGTGTEIARTVSGGNYNFVTPYSHEATHGFALGVAALLCLHYGLTRPSRRLCARC